jgi:hypothetical protein
MYLGFKVKHKFQNPQIVCQLEAVLLFSISSRKAVKANISWLFPCECRQKVVPLQNYLETVVNCII